MQTVVFSEWNKNIQAGITKLAKLWHNKISSNRKLEYSFSFMQAVGCQARRFGTAQTLMRLPTRIGQPDVSEGRNFEYFNLFIQVFYLL